MQSAPETPAPQFANQLLEKEQTVVTDGAGFGAEGFIRISYATSMKELERGLDRLQRFMAAHL